jgi:thiol-disulfide isomerase/thioredoxin
MQSRRTSFFVAAALACAVLAGGAGAGGTVSADADASKPFLVKIHADWCGTCARMNPTFEALEQKLGDQTRIVVLDVTDKETVAASRSEADRLGIRTFFDQYKSRTGTVGVLRGDTRETVALLSGETDVARYEEVLKRARSAS